MAKSHASACMFLGDLPHDAIRTVDVPNTIDSSMPGGHATVMIKHLRVPSEQMLGESGAGFRYAQVRLPARVSHRMRRLGACIRANEIATGYANHREAFGKTMIGHESVGFMLADNMIDLKRAELMINVRGHPRHGPTRHRRVLDHQGSSLRGPDASGRSVRASHGRERPDR
jgi:acyl-CoA dehydrogenase